VCVCVCLNSGTIDVISVHMLLCMARMARRSPSAGRAEGSHAMVDYSILDPPLPLCRYRRSNRLGFF
jgi:hypothetical protein